MIRLYQQLPAHYVKIDGQLVRSLQDDRASLIIVFALRGFSQGYHVHVPEALEPLLAAAYDDETA